MLLNTLACASIVQYKTSKLRLGQGSGEGHWVGDGSLFFGYWEKQADGNVRIKLCFEENVNCRSKIEQ